MGTWTLMALGEAILAMERHALSVPQVSVWGLHFLAVCLAEDSVVLVPLGEPDLA